VSALIVALFYGLLPLLAVIASCIIIVRSYSRSREQ
jgi:hypothetical protein